MNQLPDSYPFLEPCLGCFEDALQALTELPGCPVFFSNGDFTLNRFLRAVSRLVHEGEVTLCIHYLALDTIDYIVSLQEEGRLKDVVVFCHHYDRSEKLGGAKYKRVHVIECNNRSFFLQARNDSRCVTLSGLFLQQVSSGEFESYTLYNDAEAQQMIHDTIYKRFRKQLKDGGLL